MRILVATDQWFPDLRGGVARVASDTARMLAGRGHEVTVIAPREPGEPEKTSEGAVRVLRTLPRNPIPQTFTDVVYTRRRARRLRSSDFDVLLAHNQTTGAGLAAARLGSPLVLVYHASVAREFRFLRSRLPFGAKRLSTLALEAPLELFERAAVRHADRILVLSEFSRALLVHDHPDAASRVVRVPGAVDVDAFSPNGELNGARVRLGLPGDIPLLVTVRRLEPRMGLEPLLHAVRLLLGRQRVALAVAGSGSLARRLTELRQELALEEHVRFLGRVSEEDLRDLYRAADLFVLPTVAYEGFGLVTAEALASGTPVVGTPVGATPELLAPLEPRLVARDSEPAALAAAITKGLELATPDFRRRCREYACAHFGWVRSIRAWEDELLAASRDEAPRRSDAASVPE